MATREIVVNMVPGGVTPVIHVSQYDDGYGITANLIENSGTYTVPVGATVSIEGTKPDGHGYAYLCTYQDNAVVIPVNTQMTAVKGKHPCELVVRKEGLRVGSKNMIMVVEVAGLGEDTIISDTELPAIIALAQEQEEAAAASATAAASSAASAETAKDAAMDAAQDAIDAAQELQTAIQFNAALIHDTASGAVASFSEGADNIPMQSLVAEITPVQSGSGDPSPTNIRPISGRTGLTVTRMGKNILNPSAMVRGSVFVDNGDGTYTFSKTGTGASGRITWSAPVKADDGTTVTFSANITGTHESEINFGFTLNENTSGATTECAISNGRITGTITSTAQMNGVRLYWRNNSTGVGTDSVVLSNMQVEYGGVVTDYEAPSIATIPITWQTEAGTVYGGNLDVVSGVLTVEYVAITFDGTQTLTDKISSADRAYMQITGMATHAMLNDPFAICNRLPKAAAMQNADHACVCIGHDTTGNYIYLQGVSYLSGVTNLATLNAWLADNPVVCTYELATPQTYQLTPTEVRTLLGGNTVYTDAGAVSVEYVADTKLYIDNKIAELQALVLEN